MQRVDAYRFCDVSSIPSSLQARDIEVAFQLAMIPVEPGLVNAGGVRIGCLESQGEHLSNTDSVFQSDDSLSFAR